MKRFNTNDNGIKLLVSDTRRAEKELIIKEVGDCVAAFNMAQAYEAYEIPQRIETDIFDSSKCIEKTTVIVMAGVVGWVVGKIAMRIFN